MSAQHMAQSLVFKMADDELKKQTGETKFYDVLLLASTTVGEYWRGLLTTTLEYSNKYYEIIYNNETGTTEVKVFTLLDTFIIPKD